jgi:hypothetical protein
MSAQNEATVKYPYLCDEKDKRERIRTRTSTKTHVTVGNQLYGIPARVVEQGVTSIVYPCRQNSLPSVVHGILNRLYGVQGRRYQRE